METHSWFVTGTDTDVGKTFVSCALLRAARENGFSALGMKPVAAGATLHSDEWMNDDAARLRAAGSFDPGLQLINPYCFRSPIAPHIAAAEEGVEISLEHILASFETLRSQVDVVLVEGAGGFRVPLGDGYDSADLASAMGVPVIMVVGMRLGCINHALLTTEAIANRGLTLAGWVANRIDPAMLRFDENLATLQQRIPSPLLGVLPHCSTETAAGLLKLPI